MKDMIICENCDSWLFEDDLVVATTESGTTCPICGAAIGRQDSPKCS